MAIIYFYTYIKLENLFLITQYNSNTQYID